MGVQMEFERHLNRIPTSFLAMDEIDHSDSLLAKFTSVMQLVLKFSNSDRYPQEFGDSEDMLVQLRSDLTHTFFEEIYVRRQQHNRLIDRFANSKRVLISGFVGCGKTTLATAAAREYESYKNTILYVDGHTIQLGGDSSQHFKRDIGSLGLSDNHQGQLAIFWSKISDRLIETLIGDQVFTSDPTALSLRDEWQKAQFESRDKFRRLRESIHNSKTVFPKTFKEWQNQISKPPFSAFYENAMNQLEDPLDLLQNLIAFINRSQYGHIVIILDNIDDYPVAIQQALVESLEQFCIPDDRSVCMAICIREENRARIRNETAEFLSTYDKIQLAIDKQASLPAQAKNIMQDFADNRFNYLISHVNQVFESDRDRQKVELWCRERFGMSTTEFLQRHKDGFAKLVELIVPSDAFVELSEWHNFGLRRIGVHLFNLFEMFLRGQDNDLTFQRVFESVLDYDGVERARLHRGVKRSRVVQNLIYRHMVFDPHRSGGDLRRPKLLNWIEDFNRSTSEEKSNVPIHFLTLKVLKYLDVKIHEPSGLDRTELNDHSSIPYDDIARDFLWLGVPENNLQHALQVLNRPRKPDPNGLVYIARRSGFSNARSEGIREYGSDDRIFLLPSGRFYIRSLFNKSEILFWLSIYLVLNKDIYPNHISPVERYYDPIWKLQAVINNLRLNILHFEEVEVRALIDDVRGAHGVGQNRLNHYCKMFEIDERLGNTLSYNLQSSLRAYLRKLLPVDVRDLPLSVWCSEYRHLYPDEFGETKILDDLSEKRARMISNLDEVRLRAIDLRRALLTHVQA